MSSPANVIGVNLLGRVLPEHIDASLAAVRRDPPNYEGEEMAWLRANNPFFARQVDGYKADVLGVLGPDNGTAATLGMLLSSRITRTMVESGVMEYELVMGLQVHNLPFHSRGFAQMKWNRKHPADHDSRPMADKLLSADAADALWSVKHPASRMACLAGLVVSIVDSFQDLPKKFTFV